jgi:hypothetical protein
MFCPNCGHKNSKHQNYCRFCGLYLVDAARSLKNQMAFGERAYSLNNFDKFRRGMSLTANVLLAAFAVGLIWILFFDGQNTRAFIKISIFAYLFFQLVQFIGGYLQRAKIMKSKTKNPVNFQTDEKDLQSAETRKLVEEKQFVPISSVTESSSEMIFAENKTRKLE